MSLPEEGELVLATVRNVTEHGAYVTLDEYNDMLGFLHVSEVASGWVKNIERYVKEGQKTVLKVIRVNKNRKEVDLSLKQVTDEERREKMVEIKKENKAKTYFEIIKKKLNYTDEQMNEYIKKIREEYPLTYEMFEAAKNPKVLTKLDIPEEMKNIIVEISKSIKPPGVEVRGVMEISCPKPNGIEIIKKVLSNAEDQNTTITYLGSSKYRIVMKADNFKVAERSLSKIIESIKNSIIKNGGTFNFVREESKKESI